MGGNQPHPRMRPSIHGPVRRATAKPGRQPGYRLRVAWEPEWPRDPRYDARIARENRARRQKSLWRLRGAALGSILGAAFLGWHGYHLYGPRGAAGGAWIGAVLGSLLGLLLMLLLPFLLVGGLAWGTLLWIG